VETELEVEKYSKRTKKALGESTWMHHQVEYGSEGVQSLK
jgi:hypothetical protein